MGTYKKRGHLLQYRVYKKSNPTLACHCAVITGCMNVIFCMVIKSKVLA